MFQTIWNRYIFPLGSWNAEAPSLDRQDKVQSVARYFTSIFLILTFSRNPLVAVRFEEHGWDWSGGFSPDNLSEVQVKMRNHNSGEIRMLRVVVSLSTEVSEEGALGTLLVAIAEDTTGFMPYRIDNFSREVLHHSLTFFCFLTC